MDQLQNHEIKGSTESYKYRRRGGLIMRKLAEYVPVMILTNISLFLINTVDQVVAGNYIGKEALSSIQNSLIGDSGSDLRNADLECAVIDRSGIAYMGHLRSGLVDIDYKMTGEDIREIKEIATDTESLDIIKPVGNENRCEWNK